MSFSNGCTSSPPLYGDDGYVFRDGAVIGGYVEHFKIFRLYALRLQLVSQLVDICIPTRDLVFRFFSFSIVISDSALRACDTGYGKQYLFIVQMCGKTAPLPQKSIVVQPGDYIDMLPQVAQDLYGVHGIVFKRNELYFQCRHSALDLRPYVQNKLCGVMTDVPIRMDLRFSPSWISRAFRSARSKYSRI